MSNWSSGLRDFEVTESARYASARPKNAVSKCVAQFDVRNRCMDIEGSGAVGERGCQFIGIPRQAYRLTRYASPWFLVCSIRYLISCNVTNVCNLCDIHIVNSTFKVCPIWVISISGCGCIDKTLDELRTKCVPRSGRTAVGRFVPIAGNSVSGTWNAGFSVQ